MALGRDGTLWLGGWNIPGIEHRLWVNLEQDGTPVRQLRLPRSEVVMDADGDRLLVRKWDDLGVYDVEVRRIVLCKPPAQGVSSCEGAEHVSDSDIPSERPLASTVQSQQVGDARKGPASRHRQTEKPS